VASFFSKAKVLRNNRTLGKTQAVFKGIKLARKDIILLLDADLVGLSVENITALVEPLLQKKADLTISYRAAQPFFNKFIIWAQPFVSGERCFYKKEFLKIKDLKRAKDFELEMLCNKYFLDRKKRIAVVPLQKVRDFFKYEKYPFFKGLIADFKMCFSLIKNIGIKEILRQTFLISVRFQLIKIFRSLDSRTYSILNL